MTAYTINFNSVCQMTDEQFYQLCRHNPDIKFERNPTGEIIVMSPTGGDQRDQTALMVVYYPCLIIEVLSPSTEGFDRGKQFRHYRRIETLKEYILVDTERMNVECYRLNEHHKWELTSYSSEEMTCD